jgi:hypothetical protein
MSLRHDAFYPDAVNNTSAPVDDYNDWPPPPHHEPSSSSTSSTSQAFSAASFRSTLYQHRARSARSSGTLSSWEYHDSKEFGADAATSEQRRPLVPSSQRPHIRQSRRASTETGYHAFYGTMNYEMDTEPFSFDAPDTNTHRRASLSANPRPALLDSRTDQRPTLKYSYSRPDLARDEERDMDHAKQRSFHPTDPNTHRRASLSAHQHTAFRTLDHRQPTLENACSRRYSDLMTRDEPDLVVGDHDHCQADHSYIMERRNNSSRPNHAQWEYSRPRDGHAQSHHHSFSDLGRHYEDDMNGDARRRPSLAMSDLESSNDDFQQPPAKGIRRDYSSSWGRASSFSSVPSIMSSDVSGYNGIDNGTKRGTGRLKVCLSDDEESLSSEAFQADAPPRTRTFSRDAAVPSIEIAPGQFAELRGSAETHHAN